MFEDIVKSIKEPEVSNEANEVATDLMCPVPNDTPLSSDTSEYINDMAKETYGNDTDLIQTQEELKQANANASINAANEDTEMSLQKSLAKIVAGEYSALDLQREAYLNSLRVVHAEDNPAYGLAIENSRKLQTEAILNNQDILAEPADITADYNRVLTNRNMLTQARKELVPHGLIENFTGAAQLPGIALKTFTELKDPDMTAMNVTAAVDALEKTRGTFDNVVVTTLGFVPFYDSSLRMAAAKADGIKEWHPAAAEMLHYAYWQNAIENDSNDQFKDRLSKYVQYLKDKGYMDGEIDFMLNSIEDPSPILASFGFSFDVGAAIRPLLKFTSKAAGMFMKALKGAPKGTADDVIKAAEEISKGSEQITEVDLQKALKEVGVITDSKTGNAVSFPKPVDKVVGESEKVTQSLEDYLRTTDFKNTDDLTTTVGRKLAARDETGAVQDLIKTVREGNKNNKGVIRTISDNFFDSAMKSYKENKSIAHLDDIIAEKDYARLLGKALTNIEIHSANGLTGLRQDLLKNAMTGLADTLESEKSLYRTSGISDVLRSHYNDVAQESSKGDLFALVRTNKFFSNRDAAKAYATKLKSDNVETFVMPTRGGKDTVDGWAVDAKVKLNKGFGSLFAEKHPGEYRNLGFSAVYTTTSNPDYVRLLNTGRETEVAHLRELETSAQRAMAAAKGDDKKLLQTLIDQSIQDGTFYTQDYLNAKGVPQTVKNAYNAYRLMNDVDMFIINQSRHDDMVAQGLKALKLGDSSIGYGRIKRSADILKDMRDTTKRLIVGDVEADPVFFRDLDMTEKAIKEKISEGWVLVERAFGPDEFTDAASVMYFLPGHNLVENPIPGIVTNYIAGGRRFFNRTAGYVKQVVMKKGKTGRDVITGVQSFATDTDAIGLAKKTKKIEQIRKAVVPMFKSGAYDDAEVVKLIQELQLTDVPFTDARSFAKWASSRGMDLTHLDNSLEVVKDGEMISSYANLKLNYDSAIPEEELDRVLHRSAFQAMTQEAKMQKWKRTGKDLLAYNFQDTAKIVDFDKQMQYMLQDMVNARVMGKYTDFIAEDFMKRFGPNAALHDAGVINNATGKNARQLLNSVHTSKDVIGNSIRAQRALVAAKNYRAIRGIPTDADAAIADWYKKAMTAIGEKTPMGIDNLAHNIRVTKEAVFEAVQPAHLLRWNTATHFMGLLNGRQLITQSMPILYTALAKPVALGKSLKYVMPLTQELIASKGSYSKAMERFIAKEGLKSDHMKAVWKAMIDARIFENTSYAGAFESAKAGSKWEALDRINFAPKNFAEVLNRVVAHATAYEDLGFGSKGIQSAEDMMRFKSLGNSLYINMDATGMSRLQTTEAAKVLTQFWSANARWWETVLRDTNLTRAERLRIGGGVLALTGMSGMVGVNYARKTIDKVKDIYNYFNPEEENPVHFTDQEMSWVERTFERGILAWMSENYDWSDAISLPFTDMLNNVSELFDKPLESIPSWSVIDRQTELVKDLYRAAYVVKNSDDSYSAWQSALKVMATSKGLPSATKQRLTAAILWNQGMRWNTKGQLTQEDATRMDAVMALIGVPRMEATDISAAFVSNQHESAKVKEFVEETKRYWNIWKDTHDEGVWTLWTTLLKNAPLTDAQKIAAEKELIKDTEYDTVITEIKRRILYEMKHPDKGTYLIQLTNLTKGTL